MTLGKLKVAGVLALALAFSGNAFAETQNVKVSGSIDAYAFYRNNYDLLDENDGSFAPAGSTVAGGGLAPEGGFPTGSSSSAQRSESENFFHTITQVEIAADMTDNVSTVINLINQRDWTADSLDTSDTATSTSGNEFDILLDLAYVQMKEIFYTPLTLTIGRQDLLFGRGFIIGWNPQDPQGINQPDEFTQIQSFDAIRATLDFNPWTLDFVYSKISEGPLNTEDDSDLYIANVNYKFAEYNAVAEGYYVGQFDRSTLAGTAGTFDNETDTIGARVQFDPITQITLGAEGAYQFGDYRAALGDPTRDRDAMALDLFGEYRWDNTWKPMLGLQYVHLSGESDLSASANDYGSWNGAFRGPIYGWYHDYKEFYYATAFPSDQAAGQNQQHISVYGSLQPMEDLKLTAAYWYFWVDEDSHVIQTNPTTSTLDEELGHEIDLAAIYSYTEDVTFTLMADWFIPGDLYNEPFDATATQLVGEVKVTF
jgi:hypothetical protein